jgi:hypothetical protein
MKQKGFASIIIVLVLALLFVGIVIRSRPKETIDTPPRPSTMAPIGISIQNGESFPSPDGTRIAYTQDSPETLVSLKERNAQGYGFVDSSTNLWDYEQRWDRKTTSHKT